MEEMLQKIVLGLSQKIGQDFFQSLSNALCDTLKMEYGLIGEFQDSPSPSVQVIALSRFGKKGKIFDYPLENTPCETVVGKSCCVYPSQVQTLFPMDRLLSELSIESYLGIPLWSRTGEPLGLMVVMDSAPLKEPNFARSVLEIFSMRVCAELERKKTERKIKRALEEKEILLKEIHHRVKNNLQTISSLLNLQLRASDDPDKIAILRECQDRIQSMAMIHQQLYSLNDFSHIKIQPYLKALSQNLLKSFGVNPQQIDMEIVVEKDLALDLPKAIPCGLIINELVTNSLKYAFPRREKGSICICCSSEEPGNFSLLIKDSGVGFSREIDVENSPTLGLKLISILTKQLEGTMEIKGLDGFQCHIVFPQ